MSSLDSLSPRPHNSSLGTAGFRPMHLSARRLKMLVPLDEFLAALERLVTRRGTSVDDLLPHRFYRSVPLLQEAGRARHGTVCRGWTVRHAGRGVKFHRPDREALGGEHALPLDRFLDHGWREARPQSRFGVRGAGKVACGDAGHVGERLEMCLRRAGTTERRGHAAHSDDSHRAAFGDAGHQSPDGALFLPRRTDRFSREALRCPVGQMDGADRAAQKIRGVQCQSRLRPGLPAMIALGWIIFFALLAGGFAFLIAASAFEEEIRKQVNSRLPADKQYAFLSHNWRHEILRQYRTLFPEGKLRARSIQMWVACTLCFVGAAGIAHLFHLSIRR